MTCEAGQTLSHFRLIEKIGEGGMGVVWKAEDEKLQRVVALKVLPPEKLADQERRLRFVREARTAAAVTHPNIAVIHEIDEAEGVVFIAMELIEGKTLRETIGGKPMPRREALRLGVEIAEGLSAAHQAKVIHRDLKPDNVIVTPGGHVKILDFGLAKLLEARAAVDPEEASRLATVSDEMTQAGRVLGTAAYMSPEQARGLAVDARSDVFSFGIVLYEMVTGRAPFRGTTSMDTLTAILREQPVPAAQLNPEVPAELERILGMCLEKEPGERYQHAQDLVVDLRKVRRDTESQPLRKAEAAAPRASRSGSRRPIALALALAGVLLALVAAGWTAWQLWPRAHDTGGELSQRTILSGDEVGFADSCLMPDAKYFSFTSREGLVLRELASGSSRLLPLPNGQVPVHISCAPDGTQLYTASVSQGGSSIWAVSVLTGSTRRLRGDGATAPVPSPDGRLLAYRVPGSDRQALWVMNTDGDSPRRVFALEPGDELRAVAWEPNGRRLAILRLKAAGPSLQREATIELLGLDGEQGAVLVSDPNLVQLALGETGGLVWLADGRILYSLTEPPPNWNDMNVWAIPVDPVAGRAAGAPSRITNWTATTAFVDEATPDGKHLLVRKLTNQNDVYVATLTENGAHLSEPRRLTLSSRNDVPWGWTRDGRVIFNSDRNGNWDIFVQALDSREPTALVTAPGFQWMLSASPDSRAILYADLQGDFASAKEASVMLLDLADGSIREMPTVPIGFGAAMPSREGSPGVSWEPRDREIVFHLFDPARGKGPEFARLSWEPGLPWLPALSASGTRLAVPERSEDGDRIRIVDVPGGRVRTVTPKGCSRVHTLNFTADGKGLFVAAPGDGQAWRVLRADLDGETTVLRQSDQPGEPGWWLGNPLPSPDGRNIAFQSMSVVSDHWLLENF